MTLPAYETIAAAHPSEWLWTICPICKDTKRLVRACEWHAFGAHEDCKELGQKPLTRERMMFIAEQLTASRWEVVDDALPMACPVCETINEAWAQEIAEALNFRMKWKARASGIEDIDR